MPGPFDAIRSALRAARAVFGYSPQRVHTEAVRVNPKSSETRPVYRVGTDYKQKGRIDPATGQRFVTGNRASKPGIAAALARVPSGRVEVTIYGKPSWDTRKVKSPPPDARGNVHISFFGFKSDLEAALLGSRDVEDWTAQQGGYNFEEVDAVSVGEA
jgi:hypothetical protein